MLDPPFTEPGSYEIYPALTAHALLEAKSHLYKSLEIVASQLDELREGIYDAIGMSSELSDCWLHVNHCRVHTEKIGAFEEYLQPAMGLIYDAKSMVDHLAARKLGLTRHGRISIMGALQEASVLITTVLRELESWDVTEENENQG